MKYIKGYDGLRAFSILFVVLTHLGLSDMLPDNEYVQTRVSLLFSGLTGVQVFFSLSGFLITGILLKERTESGTIHLRNFYIRRFIRLLPPLLIFYAAIALLMFFKQIVTTSVGFAMAVTYTYNFIPAKFYTGELGHMWSLAVEEQFYLFWPLVLLFISQSKKLLIFTVAIIVACIAAIYALPTMGFDKNGVYTLLGDVFLVNRWFIPAAAPIMIGSAFAIIVHNGSDKLFNSVHKSKFIPLVAAALYACPLYLPMVLLPYNALIVATGVSLFLLWIYYNQQSKVCDVLERQPLSYIGKISYGIYVYQGFFLRTGPGEGLSVQQFPPNIILTIIIAVISYEFFEKKVLKLKNRFR